jgi:CO/xanthine dehydrogenase Mo-binding subunit
VFDPIKALEPGAPLVHENHPTGNLLKQTDIIKGDVDEALARADVVVTGEYTTERVEHGALEMEGGLAYYEDGRVIVKACTQNPHYDQSDIALFLGVDTEKVRMIQAETGGGFGGKLDISVQPYLALAAWHLKQPVRMCYTREESMLATGKRHPFFMRYITGADESGRLLAQKVELLADTGAFASYGLAVCGRAAVHAAGPYEVPNVRVSCRMAYTHNSWNCAMRGFGVPQVAVAHEGQMDAVARKLGLDPLEVRLKNILRNGGHTATGQLLKSGVGLEKCLEKIRPLYEQYKAGAVDDDETLRGVGLGVMFYGIGNTGVSNPSHADLAWGKDGRVRLFTGAADIGQGSDTILTQLAAARLNISPEMIDLCRGDTDCTANAGATSASRQTYISGNAVLAAADNLEALLAKEARNMLGKRHADLRLQNGMLIDPDDPEIAIAASEVASSLEAKDKPAKAGGSFDPNFSALDPETGQGKPYATYAYAAQCSKVAVDRASGMALVSDVAAAHDVGRAINRRAVIGQICGGVMMGLGYALMEQYVPGWTENLENYHLPTCPDAPRITPLIVEEPEETGPYGAKGVGEPALIPTAPSIAGAMSDAIGVPMRDLPITLERTLAMIIKKEEEA